MRQTSVPGKDATLLGFAAEIPRIARVFCSGSRVGCAWANAGDTPAATVRALAYSVRSENFGLAVRPRQRTFSFWCAYLGQAGVVYRQIAIVPATSTFAVLSRDSAYAQDSKSYRYGRCHSCFDR